MKLEPKISCKMFPKDCIRKIYANLKLAGG